VNDFTAIERRALITRARKQAFEDLLNLLCDGAAEPVTVGRRALELAIGLELVCVMDLSAAELARIVGVSRQAVSADIDNLGEKLSEKQGVFEAQIDKSNGL
jgi:hypothetical protein